MSRNDRYIDDPIFSHIIANVTFESGQICNLHTKSIINLGLQSWKEHQGLQLYPW